MAFVAIGSMVWRSSAAVFSARNSNLANTVSAGTVAFGANQPATAMFSLASVIPGDLFTACIKLSYTGNIAASVKLYLKNADLTGTGLGESLTFRVAEGSGSASDCSDFVVSGATLYNTANLTDDSKTLKTFSEAAGSFATGVDTWAASPLNANRTYQFEWQLQGTNAAQGKAANGSFTWEARSSP